MAIRQGLPAVMHISPHLHMGCRGHLVGIAHYSQLLRCLDLRNQLVVAADLFAWRELTS